MNEKDERNWEALVQAEYDNTDNLQSADTKRNANANLAQNKNEEKNRGNLQTIEFVCFKKWDVQLIATIDKSIEVVLNHNKQQFLMMVNHYTSENGTSRKQTRVCK